MEMKSNKPAWSALYSLTLRRFRAQFQDYFPPLLASSTLGYAAYRLVDWMSNALPAYHPVSVLDPQPSLQLRIFYAISKLLFFSFKFCIPWLVFSFALAIMTVKLLHEAHSQETRMRAAEALRIAYTRRFGTLCGLSFLAGMSTALFFLILLPVLLRPFPLIFIRLRMFSSTYETVLECATGILVLLFAALVTKAALAIPELLDDANASLSSAVLNSIKATTGWELYFIFLVIGLGGTLAVVFYIGKDMIYQTVNRAQLSEAGYEILLAGFCIVIAALALSLLALTYSLLYLRLRYGANEPLIAISTRAE